MSCHAPEGKCINHGACNANDGCMYEPVVEYVHKRPTLPTVKTQFYYSTTETSFHESIETDDIDVVISCAAQEYGLGEGDTVWVAWGSDNVEITVSCIYLDRIVESLLEDTYEEAENFVQDGFEARFDALCKEHPDIVAPFVALMNKAVFADKHPFIFQHLDNFPVEKHHLEEG